MLRCCAASLSSLHRFLQLLQTRWTQRLFTIYCSKNMGSLPILHSSISAYAHSHTHQTTHGAPIIHSLALCRGTEAHVFYHDNTCSNANMHWNWCFANPHKVGLVCIWYDGLLIPPLRLFLFTLTNVVRTCEENILVGKRCQNPQAPPKTYTSVAKNGR